VELFASDKEVRMIRVIVQARMGSSRLPGKILKPLGDRPLLAHVVTRLREAGRLMRQAWEVMVATTEEPADDATERWCRQHEVPVFRGAAQDVLRRYTEAAADLHDDDTVVRATADNPLYCPRRTAAIVEEHQRAGADYTCIENLSYVVPEVMQAGALRAMERVACDPYCREHVTPYFRQRPGEFRVQQLPATWRSLRPELRLTVDTPGEQAFVASLLASCDYGLGFPSLEQIYAASSAQRAA
jgi:spore coat polysaccharide biosynthesis protein SpsF